MSTYTDSIDTTKQRDKTVTSPKSVFALQGRSGINSISGSAVGVFSGEPWLDLVFKWEQITMVHVDFPPCSRAHWHKHEGGQLLKVTAGSVWVCDQGAEPRSIKVGDVIWCPPGVIHWHGADDGSFMVYQAISIGGLKWYDPVTDQEYAAKRT